MLNAFLFSFSTVSDCFLKPVQSIHAAISEHTMKCLNFCKKWEKMQWAHKSCTLSFSHTRTRTAKGASGRSFVASHTVHKSSYHAESIFLPYLRVFFVHSWLIRMAVDFVQNLFTFETFFSHISRSVFLIDLQKCEQQQQATTWSTLNSYWHAVCAWTGIAIQSCCRVSIHFAWNHAWKAWSIMCDDRSNARNAVPSIGSHIKGCRHSPPMSRCSDSWNCVWKLRANRQTQRQVRHCINDHIQFVSCPFPRDVLHTPCSQVK